MGFFDDPLGSIVNLAKDAFSTAAPILGAVAGGPLGALAGGPASALFSVIPDVFENVFNLIKPQQQCSPCPSRPLPWTPPSSDPGCDPSRPKDGSFVEDKLLDVSASLQEKLNNLIENMPENPTEKDLQKLQAQIQQITRMMDTISNILKTLHDTKKNIVGNLR
jgi:hypothetical protein